MIPVIVIVGPTGVGKTKLSISLAKKLQGEIINADSMQVYKGLNIGTAKIKEEEKEGIPHHLFNIKNINEEYTIYHYQKDARKKIKEISSRGHIPILVGGTGLYIKSALYDYQLNKLKTDINSYDKISTEELYQELIKLDKDAIDKIDKNNRRRIINAITYYKENKISITKNKTTKSLYKTIYIGLTTDRNKLYQIIDKRVDDMIEEGLIEEVNYYYQQNKTAKPLHSGIGYKEILPYLEHKITKEEAINEIKKDSRHYAKRQYTFFNHQLPVTWFQINRNNFNQTIEEVVKYIQNNKEML